MKAQDYSQLNCPIFNKHYLLLSKLGEGKTSKVYLAQHITEKVFVAVKVIREEFLHQGEAHRESVIKEVTVLK